MNYRKSSKLLRSLCLIIIGCMLFAACSAQNTPIKPTVSPSVSSAPIETVIEASAPPTEIEPSPSDIGVELLLLSREQCIEDIDFMWKTLVESFPYIQTVNRMTGLNMEDEFANLRISVEEGGKQISLEDWMSTLNSFCSRFKCLGHFTMIGASFYRSLVNLFNKNNFIESQRNILALPKVVSAYQYLLAELSNYNNNDNLEYSAPDLEFKRFFGHVAYIKAPSFGRDVDEDHERIMAFLDSIEDCDNLIIDITGNGGGSDWYWRKNFVMPLIEEKVSMRYPMFAKKSRLVTDYFSARGLTDYVDIETADLSKYNNLKEEDIEDLDIYFPNIVIDILPMSEYSKLIEKGTDTSNIIKVSPMPVDKKFHGKIYLLIDSAVFSSSESFAVFSKQTGFATIVGQKSGGDGIGYDPIVVALPSGLLFRFSTLYGVNDDGSCNQEVGTTPDIICISNENPLDKCLKTILNK